MTYLQLCQELVRLGGMAGEGGPPLVTGQSGEYRRAIEFVRIAYEDVCNLHNDWDFLWGLEEIATEADMATYAGPEDVGTFDAERIFINGEALSFIDWQDYKPESLEADRPYAFTIRPDGQLQLIPTPDAVYTLSVEYFKAAPSLAENTDVPLIPERFQRVILGRALILYGNYEAAQEVVAQGNELYRIYREMLERHQLSRRQQTHGRQESSPIQVVAQ